MELKNDLSDWELTEKKTMTTRSFEKVVGPFIITLKEDHVGWTNWTIGINWELFNEDDNSCLWYGDGANLDFALKDAMSSFNKISEYLIAKNQQ